MKIAISSMGKELSDSVAEVFGRCPYFVIAEIEDGEIKNTEAFKNESENQTGGAGVSTSKFLVEKDVNVVIAKAVGPRALDVLKQFNVEIYNGEGEVQEVLQEFIDKKLKK